MMAAPITSPTYHRIAKVVPSFTLGSTTSSLKPSVFAQKLYCRCCLFQISQPYYKAKNSKKMFIRSSLDPSPSNSTDGQPRLIRTIQDIQIKLSARIQEIRKNLPVKLLFFFVGFYCATAFATVIGQTGDWDILSAALAVVVVEGIGALMYRASLSLMSQIRDLIIMFNYWKAGLSLGLFLDSFKYEMDDGFGLSNVFSMIF